MSARFRAIYARWRTLGMVTRVGALAAASILLLGACAAWQEGRDTPAGEKAARTVSIEPEVVRKFGRFWRVRLSGSVASDDPVCVATQEVVIQSRRSGGTRWTSLGSELTDEGGNYSIMLEVRRDEELRAVASRFDYCRREVSQTVAIGG